MPHDLFKLLDELYPQHEPEHAHKLSDMMIRDEKDVAVKFKGTKAEVPGICFKVVNKKPSSSAVATLHNVVVARKPGTDHLTMWCGDTSIVKSDREKEDRCGFWAKHNGSGGKFMCKHIVFAFRHFDIAKRREVLERLGESGVVPVAQGQQLSTALGLGMNTLLFGPTGSGKTHDVMAYLKNTKGIEACQINITDGLEDVDLLQKLLPDSKGGWQRLVGELRHVFDLAREKKVICVLEELTRSSRSLRNLLIKAIDKQNGTYTLHDITTGDRVTVPCENLTFCGTANISYSDTSELDAALARRFEVCLFFDYDPDKERELTQEKVGLDTAQRICKVAKKIREQYRAGRLPYPLDTGSVLNWASLIQKGIDFAEAAQLTWLYRIVEKDGQGYPEAGQLSAIKDLIAQS